MITPLVALILVALAAPTPAQTAPDAVEELAERQLAAPLAPVEFLLNGEWRMVATDGRVKREVWTPGPGGFSLTSVTSVSRVEDGLSGSFSAIYHHPQRDELVLLGLSRALLQTGTATPGKDRSFRLDTTLFYGEEKLAWSPAPTRRISSAWSMESDDRYLAYWIEDQGQPVPREQTNWKYTRHDEVTPLPEGASAQPERVDVLKPLLPFLAADWETDTARTTFSWVPYNEAVLMRTVDRQTEHLASTTILYPHPHTGAIHALTLYASGAVDEGHATAADGAVSIRADRADSDGAVRIERRLELPDSETLRTRTWSLDGDSRALLDDVTHRARRSLPPERLPSPSSPGGSRGE